MINITIIVIKAPILLISKEISFGYLLVATFLYKFHTNFFQEFFF